MILADVEFAPLSPLLPPVSPLAQGVGGVAPLREMDWGNEHDRASRAVLLSRIAGLLGVPMLAPMSVGEAALADVLLVPGETLVGEAVEADRLLGGAVPARFVGTKAIAHGLIDAEAVKPTGWADGMAARVGDAVLAGFTAFSLADAMRAGRALLARGPVRVKDVCAKAGLGQIVVRDADQLGAALAMQDPATLAECGVVLEENLLDVVTYSVGAVTLGGRTISYWGSQNLTTDRLGREIYGGSDLYCVRGDLDALARLDLPPSLAEAVACAAIFDRIARDAYPEVVLTRRNYDVIEGTDIDGRRRVAVLEQSWRVGGASGAEIAAFEAFRDEPATASVRCATVEVHGDAPTPVGATVYYAGVDPVVGPMRKYALRLA